MPTHSMTHSRTALGLQWVTTVQKGCPSAAGAGRSVPCVFLCNKTTGLGLRRVVVVYAAPLPSFRAPKVDSVFHQLLSQRGRARLPACAPPPHPSPCRSSVWGRRDSELRGQDKEQQQPRMLPPPKKISGGRGFQVIP